MPEISPTEIAVLTTEVKHLTGAVRKLLEDMESQKASLERKADVEVVQELNTKVVLLEERSNGHRSTAKELKAKAEIIEQRLTKVEMETWKLGLMLGGSATGGAGVALVGQYLLGLILL